MIAAALALVSGATGAQAGQGWVAPGNVYIDIGGGTEWVNLPEYTAFSVNGDEFGAIEDEFKRWSAEFALGYADPDGMSLPDPFGQNARVEARVRYANGKSQAHHRNTAPVVLRAPDQNNGSTFGVPGNFLFNTELETWDADLTYQTDVVLTDHVAASPLIGLTYTRLQLDNDYKGDRPGFTRELNDKLRFNYYGLALGTDLTVRPVDALDVTLGLRGDLLWASGSMSADFDNSNGEFLHTDSDSHLAGRGTVSLGVGLSLGPLRLGVEGFAEYLSYLPVPDHPLGVADRTANVDGKEMWSAGARGSLTIWFP